MSEEIKVGMKFVHGRDSRPYVISEITGDVVRVAWDGCRDGMMYGLGQAKRYFTAGTWTLISDPSSPTKEAQWHPCTKCGNADGRGHWPVCPIKAVERYTNGSPEEDRVVAALMVERDTEFQRKQKEAIKAQMLEQQRNPRYYMAYGVVTAGGWQQRGWGRK